MNRRVLSWPLWRSSQGVPAFLFSNDRFQSSCSDGTGRRVNGLHEHCILFSVSPNNWRSSQFKRRQGNVRKYGPDVALQTDRSPVPSELRRRIEKIG